MPFAMTQVELESVMLSKISQSEKDKYHVISLMWNLRNKTNEQRKKERETSQETLLKNKRFYLFEREHAHKHGGGGRGRRRSREPAQQGA